MENNWYVIQVTMGAEKKVIQLCETIIDQSIWQNCFLPMGEYMQKSGGKWEKIKKFLFPGYIFVITDQITDLYMQLKKVPEFTKLLGQQADIIPLYKEEVQFLSRFCEQNHTIEISNGYMINDRVIVTDGPLVGMEGQIKKIDRHKRIAILKMELFGGRVTEVKMGLEVVNRLHDSKRQK